MEGSGEEREVKVEMFGVEHPFVVLASIVSTDPLVLSRIAAVLTMEMDSEKKYQSKIRSELMSNFLTTSRSASLFSCSVTEICCPIRTSNCSSSCCCC